MKKFKLTSITAETADGGTLNLTFSDKSFNTIPELHSYADTVYMGDRVFKKRVSYSVTFNYTDDLDPTLPVKPPFLEVNGK